jgi:hypothetical protein
MKLSMSRLRAHPLAVLVAALAAVQSAQAGGSPANQACPNYVFNSGNLAKNPSFELPQPVTLVGQSVCWSQGGAAFPTSAAADWGMHSSNTSAPVCSRLVPGSAPGPGGSTMLLFRAGSNEGGVYQNQAGLDPRKSYMFSVWIYAVSGQVAIQSNSFVGGPVAWTSKLGEWEQLRVCTNGLTSTNQLVIYNQAPTGGSFYADRVELREIP